MMRVPACNNERKKEKKDAGLFDQKLTLTSF